jgi:hypothetical protein
MASGLALTGSSTGSPKSAAGAVIMMLRRSSNLLNGFAAASSASGAIQTFCTPPTGARNAMRVPSGLMVTVVTSAGGAGITS